MLASGGELLPIRQSDLQPSKYPHVYHTVRMLQVGDDRFIPPDTLVQDRRRTARHRAVNRLGGIVLADMSTPERPVYVGLWNEPTRFVPLPTS